MPPPAPRSPQLFRGHRVAVGDHQLTVRGGTLVLRREIDIVASRHLRILFRLLLEFAAEDARVDTAGVTFVDVTGLQMLVAAAGRCCADGGQLTLTAASPPVRDLLDVLTRLDPAALGHLRYDPAGSDSPAAAALDAADAVSAVQAVNPKAVTGGLRTGAHPADPRAFMHAVDGDLASVCEAVAAGTLVAVDHLDWSQIAPDALAFTATSSSGPMSPPGRTDPGPGSGRVATRERPWHCSKLPWNCAAATVTRAAAACERAHGLRGLRGPGRHRSD